ncbi:hypothetical protein BB561_001552 [Smittium simulii]|uniref:Uncharacterized protein n=1 Tax=Smittium simulii TaxID=133385 RepID=A0A2T9YU31_9FUNG|nr:hypothetical protein BB561_001552 [Smittium simulii]
MHNVYIKGLENALGFVIFNTLKESSNYPSAINHIFRNNQNPTPRSNKIYKEGNPATFALESFIGKAQAINNTICTSTPECCRPLCADILRQYYNAFIRKEIWGYEFTQINRDSRKYLEIPLNNKYSATSTYAQSKLNLADAPTTITHNTVLKNGNMVSGPTGTVYTTNTASISNHSNSGPKKRKVTLHEKQELVLDGMKD